MGSSLSTVDVEASKANTGRSLRRSSKRHQEASKARVYRGRTGSVGSGVLTGCLLQRPAGRHLLRVEMSRACQSPCGRSSISFL
jgi:hypothetical protein